MSEEKQEKKAQPKGQEKLSLEEYEKIKDKRQKQRLKTNMPWFLNIILLVPLITVIGLLLIYIFYAKNLPVR